MSREQIVTEPGNLSKINIVDSHNVPLPCRTAGNNYIALGLQHSCSMLYSIEPTKYLKRRLRINQFSRLRALTTARATLATLASLTASALTAILTGFALIFVHFRGGFPHGLHNNVRPVFIERSLG
ncbi:hypothetical protein D3C74_303970 [compost metagenome]